MANVDPLLLAATSYISSQWTQEDWRNFAHETGTTDIVVGHDRLLKSLGFDDPDYEANVLNVLRQIVAESGGRHGNEALRMRIFAKSMPDLPQWVEKRAPERIKRLFGEYLAAKADIEVPAEWNGASDEALPELGDWDPRPIVELDTGKTRPRGLPTMPPSASADTSSTNSPGRKALPPFPAQAEASPPAVATSVQPNIFIVHGHAMDDVNSIRLFVGQRTGVIPVSLAEEVGMGQTIIEKFEKHGSKADFVIVLMSPDDVGQVESDFEAGHQPQARARQNVVLELGYFYRAVGRDKVVVMDGGVERPSDIAGVSYIEYPGDNWMEKLRNELDAAGLLK
jgi:predicted nucleotide-binding protein